VCARFIHTCLFAKRMAAGRLLSGLVRLGDYSRLNAFAQDFFHGHNVRADAAQLRFLAITVPIAVVIGNGVIVVFPVQLNFELVDTHAAVSLLSILAGFDNSARY
jgi:hypothetical protein